MATRTLTVDTRNGSGILADVTSVYLRAPDGSFGIRRADTLAVVVASGTPFTHSATGIYTYTFTEPSPGLTYSYWLEINRSGNIERLEKPLNPIGGTPPVSGNIPLPPSAYVEMGVETVGCGDDALTLFLNQHAAVVWAMQARRGVALDLRYQWFVLDLVFYAKTHVRMLIDQNFGSSQMQATGYTNASSTSDSSATSSRTASSSSVQSANSTQAANRNATRTSNTQATMAAYQTSSRTGSTTDAGNTHQNVRNARTTSQHQKTITTPSLVGNDYDYKVSTSTTAARSEVEEDAIRESSQLLLVGTFSGQFGNLDARPDLGVVKRTANHGIGNVSTVSSLSQDSGDHLTTRTTTISGTGKNAAGATTGGGGGTVSVDATTTGTGARANDAHRSSHSLSSASSSTKSTGVSNGVSHADSQRNSTSATQATSISHATSATTSLSHRESAGATQMVATGTSDMEFYSQIFQSLEEMWNDTVKQIKALEAQMLQGSRYLVQRLAITSPQQRSIASIAARTDPFLVARPSGNRALTPFSGTFNPWDVR